MSDTLTDAHGRTISQQGTTWTVVNADGSGRR